KTRRRPQNLSVPPSETQQNWQRQSFTYLSPNPWGSLMARYLCCSAQKVKRIVEWRGLGSHTQSFNRISALATALFGMPGFFAPRFSPAAMQPPGATGALSFYDTSHCLSWGDSDALHGIRRCRKRGRADTRNRPDNRSDWLALPIRGSLGC